MGHPVLRMKARSLDQAEIGTPRIQALIDDMMQTMTEYRGAGLAAPQVHERLRLFVASLDSGDDNEPSAEPIALINPEIAIVGTGVAEDWEGCLSIPEIRGRVSRARDIKVRAFDRHGERVEIRAKDFAARVIQHETDHLDGVLFLDRMQRLESLTYLEEYARYWAKD
jgi:peptide deformylase